jgi:hypothetical protein
MWMVFLVIRTILKTSRGVVGEKDFHHFSLIDGLKRRIDSSGFEGDSLNITIGIDGLSTSFKSSRFDVWPILCRVVNCNGKEPFVVSMWAGQSKPKNMDEFLTPFIKVNNNTKCIFKIQHSNFIL